MIRLFGLSIIVVACILSGMYFGSVYGFRVEDLKNFKKALVILKSEIEYMGTPLYQAFRNISDKLKGSPVSNIFYDFSEQIENQVFPDIAISNCLEKYYKTMYISQSDIDSIKSFGKTLGYLDKNLQLNNIELTLNYLNERIEEEAQYHIKYKKMYQTLGILAGILVVVILI